MSVNLSFSVHYIVL